MAFMRDNSAMHLLIPYAAPTGPRCQAAISQLHLPHLGALLQRFKRTRQHLGQANDLTPLHERLAITLAGHTMQDGLTAQAAMAAHKIGLQTHPDTSQGWAYITPCHWQIHADHVHMTDPANLRLSTEESSALMQSMLGYFSEDGITLHPYTHSTWLAQGDVFCDLPSASLERVVGGSVDAWIQRQPQAKPLRRLQNEMQMLLYTHPINDARTERGLPVVNSFWVSGTGTPKESTQPVQPLVCVPSLKDSAQIDDASGWLAAWHRLDSQLRDTLAGTPEDTIHITLCSDKQAHTYAYQTQPWYKRIQHRINPTPANSHLQALLPQL